MRGGGGSINDGGDAGGWRGRRRDRIVWYFSAATYGSGMARFLASGLRRDVCVILASSGELTAQQCKSELRRHYDDRIRPDTFYGALDALVSKGYVAEGVDGIHDTYALTDAGERATREHYTWVRERLE